MAPAGPEANDGDNDDDADAEDAAAAAGPKRKLADIHAACADAGSSVPGPPQPAAPPPGAAPPPTPPAPAAPAAAPASAGSGRSCLTRRPGDVVLVLVLVPVGEPAGAHMLRPGMGDSSGDTGALAPDAPVVTVAPGGPGLAP